MHDHGRAAEDDDDIGFFWAALDAQYLVGQERGEQEQKTQEDGDGEECAKQAPLGG